MVHKVLIRGVLVVSSAGIKTSVVNTERLGVPATPRRLLAGIRHLLKTLYPLSLPPFFTETTAGESKLLFPEQR